MLIEGPVSGELAEPDCIQGGNRGAFPLGKRLSSTPGYVHYLPSVIYHGLHGTITDGSGAAYAELLDSTPADMDMSQSKAQGLAFEGKVMALSCSKNYYHWLIKMLPRLHLMEEAEGGLENIETFLINKPTWQQEEVYRGLKIWERCTIINRKTYAVCRMLAAPSLAHDAAAWACRYVRNKLGVSEAAAEGGKRKIYVARGSTIRRALTNEKEVSMLLESFGFEIVDCSNLSVEEQAVLFAQSEIIVGAHGAAFANLVFCRPGATVLEIFGTPENQKIYWLMSNHMGLRYHYLMAEPADGGGGNTANITVDLGLLARSVEALSPP
jgi:capsular polysaccharide biosynthesis protein